MNYQKTIRYTIIGAVVLLAIQFTTYALFAHRQLERQLLWGLISENTFPTDSVFVRDFYTADCYSGDPWTYYSHDLANRPNHIRERFGVKFVKFQDKKEHESYSSEEQRYKLTYHTWIMYTEPSDVIGFLITPFGSTQVEEIKYGKEYLNREADYKWVLFFWLKTFERQDALIVERRSRE